MNRGKRRGILDAITDAQPTVESIKGKSDKHIIQIKRKINFCLKNIAI